jgi:hypothetical protein
VLLLVQPQKSEVKIRIEDAKGKTVRTFKPARPAFGSQIKRIADTSVA